MPTYTMSLLESSEYQAKYRIVHLASGWCWAQEKRSLNLFGITLFSSWHTIRNRDDELGIFQSEREAYAFLEDYKQGNRQKSLPHRYFK